MGPVPLDRSLDAARNLVHKLRSQGLADEADILARALEIASAALTRNREVYQHTLVSLSDLVCERLDELEREPEDQPSLN